MLRPLRIALCIIVVAGILAILFLYDPSVTTWAPKCPFKLLTGLDCPSCGAQRAIHALLHGNFARAFGFNPFMILFMPYALAAVVASACNIRKLKNIVYHRYTLSAYLALYILWGIVRNL